MADWQLWQPPPSATDERDVCSGGCQQCCKGRRGDWDSSGHTQQPPPAPFTNVSLRTFRHFSCTLSHVPTQRTVPLLPFSLLLPPQPHWIHQWVPWPSCPCLRTHPLPEAAPQTSLSVSQRSDKNTSAGDGSYPQTESRNPTAARCGGPATAAGVPGERSQRQSQYPAAGHPRWWGREDSARRT